MKFLDTSFLIDIIRKYPPAKSILEEIDKEGPHVTNTIVVHEFLVGAYGARNIELELKVREELLRKLIILPFDLKCAKESAKAESYLRKKGKYLGGADVLIIGSMKANGLSSIITRNTKHFKVIPEINIDTY